MGRLKIPLLGLIFSRLLLSQFGVSCSSSTCIDALTQIKRFPKTSPGYVVVANTSPFFIPESSHMQGKNVTVDCWSGAPIGGNILTGQKVYCQVAAAPSGNGDITVTWSGTDVGSVVISSVTTPYPVSAAGTVVGNTLQMVIPASSHHQGQNIGVDCWSGPLVNGAVTGNKVFCETRLDTSGTGTVTVVWQSNDVGSILISGQTIPGPPYVANASTHPVTISPAVHLQGPNVTVECWSGPLVSTHITGTKVFCNPSLANSGNGDLTIDWGDSDVKSYIISASGPSITGGPPGPAGPQGPPGPPGPDSSYFTNATSSPQSIPQATHMQGAKPNALCYSGPVTGGIAVGAEVYCGVEKTSTGDFTIYWTDSAVGSIQIKK